MEPTSTPPRSSAAAPSAPPANGSAGRRVAGVLIGVLLLGLGGFLLLRQAARTGHGEAAGYRIVEDERGQTEWRLAVELDAKALKTDIEDAAEQLLASAPTAKARRIDFWLGPKSPFNPVYASVMLEPGQPNQPFRLYLHRH